MIERAIAFLEAATLEDLDALPPARQRKFAQMCRHWHETVERRLSPPKAGVLRDLKDGGGRSE